MIRKLFLRRMQRHTSLLEEKSSLRQMVGKPPAPRQNVEMLIPKKWRRLRCGASTIGFRWFAKRSLVHIIAHVIQEVQHVY
jgi:hypothetical protein